MSKNISKINMSKCPKHWAYDDVMGSLTRKQKKALRQHEQATKNNAAKEGYKDKCSRQAKELIEAERGPFVMKTNNLLERYKRQIEYGEIETFWVWGEPTPWAAYPEKGRSPSILGEALPHDRGWRKGLGLVGKRLTASELNRQVRTGPHNGPTYK